MGLRLHGPIVLGLLFGNPERSFYASEIMRHADAGIGTVQREPERLSAAGLLTVTRIGNQKHYQANRDSPIFEEMEAIILKTMAPGTHRASAGAMLPLSGIIDNIGTIALEATGSGGLVIDSGLANTGSLWANGGDVTLHGDVTGAGNATISGTATRQRTCKSF